MGAVEHKQQIFDADGGNVLTPKQRAIRERDARILSVGRSILLEHGYFGLTMDRVAKETQCPKGTLYHRFSCKEDIITALATDCLSRRNRMMIRGASFRGRPRERLTGVAEGVGLFSRMNPDDSKIIHMAIGPLQEKVSLERLTLLTQREQETIDIVQRILVDAISIGDLVLPEGATLGEIVLGAWGLVDGAISMIEGNVPQRAFGIHNPYHTIWCAFNRYADGYGWRPLFNELDFEEVLARVRQEVFPVEAQALYGEGGWYGDGG